MVVGRLRMSHGVPPLAEYLAPDSVGQWERAASLRFREADILWEKGQLLAAIYLYGCCVELCLAAACFRSAGFAADEPIGRETRLDCMKDARKRRIMEDDPHPLVGWARLVREKRGAAADRPGVERLDQAVTKAEQVYKHWRPELRYKTAQPKVDQLNEVRQAAIWFIDNRGRL